MSEALELARARARREHPEIVSRLRVMRRTDSQPTQPLRSGEQGYTPSEMDFCHVCFLRGANPATYQPTGERTRRGRRKRACAQCGSPEEVPERSFHDRTGVPYVRTSVGAEG